MSLKNNGGEKSLNLSRRDVLKCGMALGLAAALPGGAFSGGCVKGKQKGPNLLLISLDTTRVDRLGCYGYTRPTTPNLDRLAENSVVYSRAVAPSSWTLPSHASLFTGKFVSSHGARYDPEGPLHLRSAILGPESWTQYRARGLSPDEMTMAEVLKEAGYSTGAVVAGPWMKKVFGLSKGFDFYDDGEISTVNGRLARSVTSSAIGWLEKSQDRPFFLFLNYFDAHQPYMAPEGFHTRFLPKKLHAKFPDPSRININKVNRAERSALYDAEILYMDHYIGKLIEKLKSNGLFDRTWIIVTADHGELIGEHGMNGHGRYLFQPEIHIPLFMKFPGSEASSRSVDSLVQLTDIFPMVCQRLNISAPEGIQGEVPSDLTHPIISETYPLKMTTPDGSWRAIIEGDYKFVWNSKGNHLLFNLKEDPGEEKNLAGTDSARVKDMAVSLNRYLATLQKPGEADSTREVDEETIKALKSLGYLE